MRYGRSDGHIPRDWQFILGLQLAFAFGVLIVAFVMAPFLPVLARAREGDPTPVWVALAAAIVGIVLLFVAKLPLYRQGRYFTFGPRALPPGRRRVYRAAYIFVGSGLVLMLLLVAVLR